MDAWYSELESALNVPFSFERRPEPLPASLRPERRLPLLLLLVAKCHGANASWMSLQLLSWAVRSNEHMKLIVSLRAGSDVPDRPLVRFEPALSRAIDLAVGLGFLELKASRTYRLTQDGRQFLGELQSSSVLTYERSLLDQIEGKITQKEVGKILEWRHL